MLDIPRPGFSKCIRTTGGWITERRSLNRDMPTLSNPLGLIALLGIPAVLVIHFLQRKARELPVSTLFLLEHTRREAASGRRFERLIPSIPLWMQLLAVLLLTWILVEPRYPKSGSIQRIGIVMDSSASMGVFKDAAIARLKEILPSLRGQANEMQWTVFESLPNRPRIHAGNSIEELTRAIESWQPASGPVDPTQALRLARSLVSRDGMVLYLTDTPQEALPFDARLISVGKPLENVGFTGVSFAKEDGAVIWRAMVKNHGKQTAERTWSLQTAAGSTPGRAIRLEPGAMMTLQSAFPANADSVRAVLSPDAFPQDDVLPMVLPQPKTLRLANATSPAFSDFVKKLTQSMEHTEVSIDGKECDLTVASYNPLDPVTPKGNALMFLEDETRTGAWLKGGIVAESHPLMDGLHWQSLLVRETIQFEGGAGDRVLLWQDKRPLILLRENDAGRQLLINFDPSLSNAEKQPAFVILCHRFADSIRERKIAPAVENLEACQPIPLAFLKEKPLRATATTPDGKPLPLAADEGIQNAIRQPGFQTIVQDRVPLLTAAVHFGDPRESDFTACATNETGALRGGARIEQHTKPDPLWRIWILLLAAALLVSWKFSTGRQAPAAAGT